MRSGWQAVNVRARGLGTRLLGEARLADLERAAGLAALGAALGAAGWPTPVVTTPIGLDRSIGERAAGQLRLLGRWADRAGVPPVLFDDEDRHALRILLRAAAEGVSPATRLLGLVPTATLPRATLERLAAATSAREVAERVAASRHPVASALARVLPHTGPDLLHLEVAVCRVFAARARRLARCGPRDLRRWLGGVVDVQNAWSVLLADPTEASDNVLDLFIAGGERLSSDVFRVVIGLPDEPARRRGVATAFAGTPLARVFGDPSVPLARLEERVLDAWIDEQRRAARLDPLGPATTILYVLRLRSETVRLRQLAWRAGLGEAAAAVAMREASR